MVDCVTFEKTTYNELPFKFEAGTTNYVGAAGLETALLYLKDTGIDRIMAWEQELLRYATEKLSAIEGLEIYGRAPQKISILSFLLDGIHQYDAGMVLDKMGIAIRTGTHCAQPVMDHFNVSGTMRASMVLYNSKEEVDRLAEGLKRVREMFGKVSEEHRT